MIDIYSDGTAVGTRVLNTDTKQQIEGIKKLQLTFDAVKGVSAKIEMTGFGDIHVSKVPVEFTYDPNERVKELEEKVKLLEASIRSHESEKQWANFKPGDMK